MAMAVAMPLVAVRHSPWRGLCPSAPAMGQQPLERRNGLVLMPAVAVFTTSLSGRVCITYADQSYGLTNRIGKKENRVFPIFSQKQDGEYSTAQLSAQNRISGSRSFVGTLLEKALFVFVKSQLDDCEDLSVAVGGSNLDILGGNVRRIEVSATKATYKGVVISEVGLAAYNVRAELGRKRLFQHPFRVNANIRIREQDFNTSLSSPLLSSSFKDILPRYSQPLRVQYDNGNLRFSSSDKQSGRYGQIESPVILRVGVEKGGEVISVESSKSGSLKKTFKVGPEVKITDFQCTGQSYFLEPMDLPEGNIHLVENADLLHIADFSIQASETRKVQALVESVQVEFFDMYGTCFSKRIDTVQGPTIRMVEVHAGLYDWLEGNREFMIIGEELCDRNDIE